MLWDLIFQFYVIHVFGGYLNGTEYKTTIGSFYQGTSLIRDDGLNSIACNFSSFWYNGGTVRIPLGNYLSLIGTIITLIAILLFCVFIIKKIIGIMFRLATGSSAF